MVWAIVSLILQVVAFVYVWRTARRKGREEMEVLVNCLMEERNIANRHLQEVMKEKHLLEEKYGPLRPAVESRWLPGKTKEEQIVEMREKIGAKKSSGRTPPPPRPRIPMSNFGGGHTTHHTHHDHLPGVVLGVAIHEALASSGDGCVVVPDYTNGPTQQDQQDVSIIERNSCVDSTPAYEAPSHSSPSYEAPSHSSHSYESPSCSSSTDYSSGSTDFGSSDTSSSSSFGD